MIAGEFKRSYVYDNAGSKVDWNKKTQRGFSETARVRHSLHTTGDRFMGEVHDYKTFITDQEDMPRLSILDNYKQIMRIMTNSYVRSFEEEKKFRNRDVKDVEKDPEFAKYREERTNTLKMSTILKSLNSPKKKRKVIQQSKEMTKQ